MTKNDVLNVFSDYIIGDNILVGKGDALIKVDDFVSLFQDVPITYNDLVAADGGNLGFKGFFDKCKVEGVLT